MSTPPPTTASTSGKPSSHRESSHRERDSSHRHSSHRHRHRHRSSSRDRDSDRKHRPRSTSRSRAHSPERSHRRRHSRDRKHTHRHRSRSRDRHGKRRRHGDDSHSHRHYKSRKESPSASATEPPKSPPTVEEAVDATPTAPRDSWMVEPTADAIDYTQRGARKEEPTKTAAATAADYAPIIHRNELNRQLAKPLDEYEAEKKAEYVFGDSGSKWRLTKLKRVYEHAKEEGKTVEEVAVERYGSLELFDEAREEEIEMSRREMYGTDRRDYKEGPTGDLYRERMNAVAKEQELRAAETSRWEPSVPSTSSTPSAAPQPALNPTELNKLRAALMKAQLRGDPKAAALESQYNAAIAARTSQPEVVLTAMHSRELAGLDSRPVVAHKGKLVEAADMSIDDMMREERRTKDVSSARAYAERISRDAKYTDDLDYLDENASKLATRIQRGDIDIKNTAINEFQKQSRALDTCPLCEQDGNAPVAPVVSLATRVFLTLPTEPEVAKPGAMIVPLAHKRNLLECDDDEWEEIRNFMKSLTRYYASLSLGVIFYESAAAPQRRKHAALTAVPLPFDLAAQAPAFFKEAILAADEEWAQHKKILDTTNKGKNGFRRTLAKEMPYFHVWFTIDGGMGHVVEDEKRWPRGDRFAREVLGGMVGVERDVWGKEGRWRRGADKERVEKFREGWAEFDWSKVLYG